MLKNYSNDDCTILIEDFSCHLRDETIHQIELFSKLSTLSLINLNTNLVN